MARAACSAAMRCNPSGGSSRLGCTRSACEKSCVAVQREGVAIVVSPAALAASTPLAESSIATQASAGHAQRADDPAVQVRRGLLLRHLVGARHRAEPAQRLGAEHGAHQRLDVRRRAGGRQRELHARFAGLVHEARHAGASGRAAVADQLVVEAGLLAMDRRHQAGQALLFRGAHPEARNIVREALGAARNPEQRHVFRLAPVPAQVHGEEGGVERLAVHFLGVRDRAVDVEDQRLQRHRFCFSPRPRTRGWRGCPRP